MNKIHKILFYVGVLMQTSSIKIRIDKKYLNNNLPWLINSYIIRIYLMKNREIWYKNNYMNKELNKKEKFNVNVVINFYYKVVVIKLWLKNYGK